MDTAAFPLSPLLSLNADQRIPQLFPFLLCNNFMLINAHCNFSIFFLCNNFMFIIAYLNFSTFSYVITCCWSILTANSPFSPLL